MKKKITAIIPVKKNSVRLKNKNFIPFYKNKSLLEIKIIQLKKLKFIDQIVISSDFSQVEKLAKKYSVSFHKREKYYASDKCSGSEFFYNLASSIEGDYLVYAPCTSPIIYRKTYNNFFKTFFKFKDKYNSYNTVSNIKHFLWKKNKPLNYDVTNAPNSQNLPDNFYTISFGISILSKKMMMRMRNIVGVKPKFIVLDKVEATDIDDGVDFELAKILYKKNYNKLL